MFKEPFILLAISSGLLFQQTVHDFWSKIVIPMVLGGVMGILLLISIGTLGDYFNIYLKYMIDKHISIYSSPIFRSFKFNMIASDVSCFSICLGIIIIVCIEILLKEAYEKLEIDKKSAILQIAKLLFVIWCASFAVGLGGQYYNHHFVFAVPFYFAIIIVTCNKLTKLKPHKYMDLTVFIICPLLICLLVNSSLPFGVNYEKRYKLIKSKATYVDELIDYYKEDTYQYFGFNGENQFIGLTKHSPKGPAFVQDSNNFKDKNNWFCQQLLKQLQTVNIVIVDKINVPAIESEVENILNNEFIQILVSKILKKSAPEGFTYKVYYRKTPIH